MISFYSTIKFKLETGYTDTNGRNAYHYFIPFSMLTCNVLIIAVLCEEQSQCSARNNLLCAMQDDSCKCFFMSWLAAVYSLGIYFS